MIVVQRFSLNRFLAHGKPDCEFAVSCGVDATIQSLFSIASAANGSIAALENELNQIGGVSNRDLSGTVRVAFDIPLKLDSLTHKS